MPQKSTIRRLRLLDFRSYAALDLKTAADSVVLVGENGVGKTNILEAISLFCAGRGLRRAHGDDFARTQGSGRWAASIEVESDMPGVQLGTGLEDENGGRRHRLQHQPVGSARAFADYIRIVWQTPAMDGLFTGTPGERRRFVDRLVLAVDADHAARVHGFEKALRNRNRLLEQNVSDRLWMEAAEREVAETAVAVAAARLDVLARLAALIEVQKDETSPFPFAELALQGEVETFLAQMPAIEVEQHYCRILADYRSRDAQAKRTLIGPHASDLHVVHGPKQIEARRTSTGEQKALLTGLTLAHARLIGDVSGLQPIILLDEIAAHFDPRRRQRLFEDLNQIGAQVWMTGADPHAFETLAGQSDLIKVTTGAIEQ